MKLSAALWLSMAVAASGAWAHEVATSADSALNLLDATDFFVCGAAVPGLSGHYVRSDEIQSDEHTPVFVREDEDGEESALAADSHDFRLYRHNGFWLLADVAAWPPKTHFRCDPTKRDIDGVNTLEACGMSLGTPPRVGYSPVDPAQAPLELQDHDCFGAGGSPFATPRSEL